MKNSTFLLLILFGFSSNFLYAGITNPQPVPMFRGNSELTGELPGQSVNKLSGVKFTFETKGAIRSTPAIVNGTVYFGSTDSYFYAIDAQSSAEKWKFKTDGAVSSSPAVSNNEVWFTSRDGYLYSLDAQTGNEIYKFKLGEDAGKHNLWDFYLSSPNIVDNVLYIGSPDGNLYAIDITSKNLKWKFDCGAKIRTTPAISGDVVFFGAINGNFYAVSKDNGTEKWKFATDGASIKFEDAGTDRNGVYCSPSVSAHYGIVTFGARDGILYALNTNDGSLKWKIDHEGPWVLSTAIKDDNVLAGSGSDAIVQCININTGVEKWRFQAAGMVFSSISILQDAIYFNDMLGNVYAADIRNGDKIWSFPLGSRAFSTPVVSDGIVYCSSDDGNLYALQGAGSESTKKSSSRKIVYWEGNKTDMAFSNFPVSTGMFIRDYFTSSGYELMDAKKLEDFMNEQINSKTTSVVVFADNKVPPTLAAEKNENALIRRYLNTNGKVVFFAPNPLMNVRNDTVPGGLTAIDYTLPGKVFGMNFSLGRFVNSFSPAFPTDEGKKMGLRKFWSCYYVTDPGEVTTVLAKDEFGMAASWIKNYGGPEGTGLVQLTLAKLISNVDLAPFKAVIEYGIDW